MAAITSSQDYAPHSSHLHLHSVYVGAITLACALLIVVVTVTACHCRVHETYKRCFVLPCSVVDMEDPLANLPLHKSTRGKPLLDSLNEPLTPSPTSKTAPLLECDMYYAMDLSDSQSSPLIVQPPRFMCPLDRADRVRM